MNLEDHTEKELRDELERRQREALKPPVQLDGPDFSKLRATCQEYIDCLTSGEYCSDDYDHWIYAAALEAIYGKVVWEFINRCLR